MNYTSVYMVRGAGERHLVNGRAFVRCFGHGEYLASHVTVSADLVDLLVGELGEQLHLAERYRRLVAQRDRGLGAACNAQVAVPTHKASGGLIH